MDSGRKTPLSPSASQKTTGVGVYDVSPPHFALRVSPRGRPFGHRAVHRARLPATTTTHSPQSARNSAVSQSVGRSRIE